MHYFKKTFLKTLFFFLFVGNCYGLQNNNNLTPLQKKVESSSINGNMIIINTFPPLEKEKSINKPKYIPSWLMDIGPDWSITFLTLLLSLITGLLAFYTLKLWKSTAETVQDNKNLSINQLRAYMGIHLNDTIGLFVQNQPIVVTFSLINHGQTVATNINITCVIDVLDYPLPENYNFEIIDQKIKQDGILFPNQTGAFTRAITRFPVSNEQKQELINPDPSKTLYLHGTITYDDIYHISRTTDFCYFMLPDSFSTDKQVIWTTYLGKNKIT